MQLKILTCTVAAALAAGFSPVFAQNTPLRAPLDDTSPSTSTSPAPVPAAALDPATGTAVLRARVQKASEYTDDQIRALGSGPAFPYDLLESALSGAVDDKGAVNYNRLQLDQSLALFVRAVGLADLRQFPAFKEVNDKGQTSEDRTSELTFWINAYNGLILSRLARAYPLKSVGSVKELHSEKVHLVAGKTYSLNEIRDRIGKADGRALFALTDGTQSGPRAPRSVYRFSDLGFRLNAAVRAFVDDPLRVIAPDRMQGAVLVSPWLQSVDGYFKSPKLKRRWDGIREILSAYTTTRVNRNFFITGNYEIRFLPASDTINDQVNVIS